MEESPGVSTRWLRDSERGTSTGLAVPNVDCDVARRGVPRPAI